VKLEAVVQTFAKKQRRIKPRTTQNTRMGKVGLGRWQTAGRCPGGVIFVLFSVGSSVSWAFGLQLLGLRCEFSGPNSLCNCGAAVSSCGMATAVMNPWRTGFIHENPQDCRPRR
jgi:hypothetical protein